jgi:hypothetical protein
MPGDAGGLVDIGLGRRRWNEGEMGSGDGDGERAFVSPGNVNQDQIGIGRGGEFREVLGQP